MIHVYHVYGTLLPYHFPLISDLYRYEMAKQLLCRLNRVYFNHTVYHAVIFISPDYSTEVHEVAQEGRMNFMSRMNSRISAEYARNIRQMCERLTFLFSPTFCIVECSSVTRGPWQEGKFIDPCMQDNTVPFCHVCQRKCCKMQGNPGNRCEGEDASLQSKQDHKAVWLMSSGNVLHLCFLIMQ